MVVELDDSFRDFLGIFAPATPGGGLLEGLAFASSLLLLGPVFPDGFFLAVSSASGGEVRFVNVALGVSDSGDEVLLGLSRVFLAGPLAGRGDGCFLGRGRGEALFFLLPPGAGGWSSSGTSSVPSGLTFLKWQCYFR